MVSRKLAFMLRCRIDEWGRGLNEIEQISKEVSDIAKINQEMACAFIKHCQ